MPPQQSERLLDLVYEALDFGAHGSGSDYRLHLATKVERRNRATMLEAGGRPTKIDLVVNPVNSVSVKFLVTIVLVGVVGPKLAAAATVSETLDSFGFFGTWAISCHEPASPSNNLRSAFISASGDAMFNESLGPDSQANVYMILKAIRSGDGDITLRTKLNGETEQELTMRMDGDRIRTLSNRDLPSRKYVVRNGRVVSNRRVTPWLTHCTSVP